MGFNGDQRRLHAGERAAVKNGKRHSFAQPGGAIRMKMPV
jgi:hypothetical protein